MLRKSLWLAVSTAFLNSHSGQKPLKRFIARAAAITGLKASVNETRVLLNYVEGGREFLADIRSLRDFSTSLEASLEMTERQT